MAVDTTSRIKETARFDETHTFVASEGCWIICEICGQGLGRRVHFQDSKKDPEEDAEPPRAPLRYYGDDNPDALE